MFRIAICDDDLALCSDIESILLEYAHTTFQNIEVDVYTSGEELCKYMKKDGQYNLIFLDIEMAQLSGVEVGKRIREEMKNELVHIIYISAMQEYAMELFESRPLNFLVKPLTAEKIIKNVEKSIKLSRQENKIFEFKVGKIFYKIPYEDIYYFVSEGKKVKIVTKDATKEYYGKLSELRNVLCLDRFVTIHKSYIVNYAYIKEYHYDHVKLVNDQNLSISQAYRKEIRERLLKQKRGRK